MAKSKKRQSLRGAVLIMILTVMVVLIIMLMATLTVVTSSSQRVYTKYEENQAYYTARSALDVFMNNLMTDSAYVAKNGSGGSRQFTDDDEPAPVDMKQGLALQLDLYKIQSQNTDGIDYGFAENTYPTDLVFASSSSDEANYALDATGAPSYVEYEVTFPVIADSSDSYGRFVDTDSASKQVAKIKIEVLDRRLDTGSYTEAELLNCIANPSSATPSVTDIKAAIAAGNRSKDYFKIKLTSTVEVFGTEGTAVVIFETTKKIPPSGGPDDTYGKQNPGSGANGSSGGFGLMEGGDFKLDANKLTGNGYTPGTVTFVSSSEMQFAGGSSVVAMDGINQSNQININAVDPNSFMFSAGTINVTNSFDTTKGANVPVIADTLVKSNDADMKTSDLYVRTLEIKDNNANKIHVTNNAYVQNIILPNNNQFFTGGNGSELEINMDAFSNMNLKLCNDFTFDINGIKYSALTYGTTWKAKNIDTYDDFKALYGCSGNPFNKDAFTMTLVDGKRPFRVYEVPFIMENGKKTIEVVTHEANFAHLFDETAYNDNGDLNLDGGGTPANYSDRYSNTNISALIKDAADILAEYEEIDTSTNPITIESFIADTSNNVKPISELLATSEGTTANSKKYVEFNVDGGDQYYYFDTDHIMDYEIRVKGSGGRLILLLAEGETIKLEQSYITTDDLNLSTTEVIYGETQASPVDIYCGTGAVLNMTNKSYIAGYVNAPTATVNTDGGPLDDVDYTGPGGNTVEFDDIYLSGGMVAGVTNTTNKPTNTGLSSDSGGAKPGEPHLAVSPSEYVRS